MLESDEEPYQKPSPISQIAEKRRKHGGGGGLNTSISGSSILSNNTHLTSITGAAKSGNKKG
jgi:hypothetical protein